MKPPVQQTRHRLSALALAAAFAGPAAADDQMLDFLRQRGLLETASAEPAPGATAELVLAAMNFLDLDYRYGGSSVDEGFDCSGFTAHVFDTVLGLKLPRSADEQAQQAGWLAVDGDRLQPGDLVFFNTMRRSYSHVGIYIGGGRFIHAPRTGAQVRVESLRSGYWTERFDGARRVAVVEMAEPALPR